MGKRIIVISSSPRKGGNSDLLCDQVVKGAEEAGHQTEKISLRDKRINYCTGCGTCISKKNGCSQKDDMTEILEKMIAADVIVMATPVYFYTMCGQIKTLIDRTYARYTEISDKDFYFIVTAADNNKNAMKRTIEEFRGFTYCLDGAEEKGIIYGTGAWNKGDINRSNAVNLAYNLGKGI
jgi:multimeric flavodoxin WrbA